MGVLPLCRGIGQCILLQPNIEQINKNRIAFIHKNTSHIFSVMFLNSSSVLNLSTSGPVTQVTELGSIITQTLQIKWSSNPCQFISFGSHNVLVFIFFYYFLGFSELPFQSTEFPHDRFICFSQVVCLMWSGKERGVLIFGLIHIHILGCWVSMF